MTPEHWRLVKDHFDRALDRPLTERADYLARLAQQDAALSRQVEQLLSANASAGEFLETPAVEMVDLPPVPSVPARIGPYDIDRELGHGGMGTVYLASRTADGFRRSVALKLVRRGMDSEFILDRFRSERRILAGLEHPGIARLLDGGSTEDGAPYFVMEYISGRHLLDEARERRLSVRDRLLLFLQVCDAVAYAHRHLVVHRDIKPSNVLVDENGSPKLLDFGLAKLLRGSGEGDSGKGRTETALRLLTPDYASPEQVRGEHVTTATDIYSLGVVLYELLTGKRPYRVTGRSREAIARAVCEEEPLRPSAAAPALKGDLDNVVLMALRKEPERRYASVEQLAEDVRRHLEGRPVSARKDTVAYRAGKFVTRHKAGVASATLAVLLLAGATVAALQQAREARRERAAAERHFNEVRELADSFLFEFHDAIKDLPGSTPARRLVVRRALEYLEKLSNLKAGDEALEREVATAYERVARVQGGLLESHLGDTRGARESLGRALAIRRALAAAHPKDVDDRAALAEARLQLSEVLMEQGDAPAAVAEAGGAVAALGGISAAGSGDRALETRLARGRRSLGLALARAGRRDEALASLGESAATFESLAAADPGNSAYRRELAITHQMTVHALAGSRDAARASASYARALDLQEGLVRADPGNFSLRRELAYTHVDMGSFFEWSGDEAAALEAYARAVPLLEALVAADPRNADARLLLAEAYNSVGYGQVVSGRVAVAGENLSRSLRLFGDVTREDPANARAQVGLARLYESLGSAAEARREVAGLREARGWYTKSRGAYLVLGDRGLLDPRAIAELEAVSKKLAALPPA